MGNIFYFDWEIELIKWLQLSFNDAGAILSSILGFLGSDKVLVFVIMLIYIGYDKNIGRKVMVNTIVGLCFASGIKNIFKRLRPYFVSDEVICLNPVDSKADLYDVNAQGYSFPSLHSYNIACISGSISKYLKKKYVTIISIVISFCVGLSRVVSANHFPSDVLAGWLIGIIALEVMSYLQDKLNKHKLYIVMSLIMLSGFFFCESDDFFTSYGIMIGFFIADYIETKYVNFEVTNDVIKIIIRMALAILSFLVIVEGMKLIYNPISGTMVEHIFRSFRYAVGIVVSFGIIPSIYKRI